MGLYSVSLDAQITEEQAKQELQDRGINDEEVQARLLARGIDVNNIDINNPQAVFDLEKNVKEILAELEEEEREVKEAEAAKELLNKEVSNEPSEEEGLSEEEANLLAKSGEEISDAVEDGSTVEEAISEQLNDAQNDVLPDAVTYGQSIFRSQNIKLYRQSKDIKPPASYVLGVGDIISVSIWGYSEEDLVFEVNEDGYIKPYKIPRIYVKGIKLGEVKELLKKRFSNYYRFNDDQFEVALNYGRTINVSIVGSVYNFGSFNIPAINTAFNALVAAGGPSNIGSVRNIKLKRDGEEDKNIDVYKYLLDPSMARDFYLQEQDIIFVPVADKLIHINGAIIRPAQYELKQNEDLVELIKYAGGLKANASLQNIQITRFENNKEKIIDVNLGDVIRTNKDFKLKNGDKITVFEIPEVYKNFVTLGGAVAIPGEYAIEKGTTIKQLLSRTELNDDAYLDMAYLKRTNTDLKTNTFERINLQSILEDSRHPDNLVLQNKDELVIYSKSRFVDNKSFSIQGNVREPGEIAYDFSKNLKLSDAVLMAGGLKQYSTDFAYLKRKDNDNPTGINYLRVDIKEAVQNPNSPANIEIQAFDSLVVYNKLEYEDLFTVEVKGNVRNPGEYQYSSSLTVNDVITLSGGLTFNASRKRIDLYRLDIKDEQETRTLAANLEIDENNMPISGSFELQPFDMIVIRPAPEYEGIKTVTISGEVKYPGTYAIIKDNEKISSIIERAGGLTNEAFLPGGKILRSEGELGYISLDMQKALDRNDSEQNIIVKNGDKLQIPKNQSLITILGAVKSYEVYNKEIVNQGKIVIPFEKGKDAKYYIDNYAGGLRDTADKDNITVTAANGRVTKTERVLFWRKYPKVEQGATINAFFKAPEKEKKENESNTDWSQILTDTVAQATSVLTLLLLVNRID